MFQPIDDFIKSGMHGAGIGYYELHPQAVRYAHTLSKSQKRKWKHYGIVPAAFLRYLEAIGAIPKRFVPEKDRTLFGLSDLLWEAPTRNRARASEGEHLRVAILKQLDLMPSGTGSAQHIYMKADLYGNLPKRQKARSRPDVG